MKTFLFKLSKQLQAMTDLMALHWCKGMQLPVNLAYVILAKRRVGYRILCCIDFEKVCIKEALLD